ncbi:hypothetical protein [Pediococcus acidilactici]|uniref:hypothetical protein n=1 Tax=Pediococcus acidilactici TaxID=1254 RepID=UPI0018978C96|nr:hypothetical protein [Pediococcus acidilactici]MDB8870357.1 hypothetical protein [Pediococcus acidilactici]MDB8878104.1 hypothetical protein [Pediococcus acidilactici]
MELAVLNFSTNPEGKLEYNTPITNDVLGFLTWERAVETLTKIKELPSNKMED